jgi:DNA recombination protein RmuC
VLWRGKLYDKFVLFAEALEEVGHRIEQAQESYHTARKRLIEGGSFQYEGSL